MKGFDIKYLEQQKKRGLIRDFKVEAAKPKKNGRIVSKHFKKRSKEKDWIASELLKWCQERSFTLKEELQFNPPRKFRFDWAIIDPKIGLKLACEYEGIYSKVSRHTTRSGYAKDCSKYNSAAALGWVVLRFTAGTYKELLNELNSYYANFVEDK